jgi:molybdopterin synthase catalytic subunit
VLSLSYECYDALAYKVLLTICAEMREKFRQLFHIAIVHRIGALAVGEASVIVAVSSIHRSESLSAVRYAIDELKRRVPIWKKEFYAPGGCPTPDCKICKETAETRQDHDCNCKRNYAELPAGSAGAHGAGAEIAHASDAARTSADSAAPSASHGHAHGAHHHHHAHTSVAGPKGELEAQWKRNREYDPAELARADRSAPTDPAAAPIAATAPHA